MRNALYFTPFDGVGLAYARTISSEIERLSFSRREQPGLRGDARAILRALDKRVYRIDTVYMLTKQSDEPSNTLQVRCANRAMIAIAGARGARIIGVDTAELSEAHIALGSNLRFDDAASCAVVVATLLRRALFAGYSIGRLGMPMDSERRGDCSYLRKVIQQIRKGALCEMSLFGTIESAA